MDFHAVGLGDFGEAVVDELLNGGTVGQERPDCNQGTFVQPEAAEGLALVVEFGPAVVDVFEDVHGEFVEVGRGRRRFRPPGAEGLGSGGRRKRHDAHPK